MGSGHCQCDARGLAVRRSCVVGPHHRYAHRCANTEPAAGMVAPWLAPGRVGRVRHLLDRRGHAHGPECRPPFAPQPAECVDRLFRARAAVAADLSRQYPFGPPHEGDVAGHGWPDAVVAGVLPRSSHVADFANCPVADLAVHQLAAGISADCALRCLRSAHDPDRAQNPRTPEFRRASLFGPRGTRLRHFGQHCLGTKLRAARSGGIRTALRSSWSARCCM